MLFYKLYLPTVIKVSLILPLSCLKSYCSVLRLSLMINESEAEKSATVAE